MKRGVEQRYAWIEASLRFAGEFGGREKKAYRDRFGLTDSMVSRDQDAFLRLFNERCNLVAVVKQAGRLVPVEGSLPDKSAFALPRMTQWLEDALGDRFEAVSPIRRAEPPHAVLHAVLRAIGARRRLRIRYRARTSGESTKVVSPHTVVDVAGRLHLRGWDHSRTAPRDFVLSRMISATVLDGVQGYVRIDADSDWTEHVVLEVLLRDGEDLAAVRPDYDLDEFGRALRRERRAHMRYFLDDNGPYNDPGISSPVTVRLWSGGER